MKRYRLTSVIWKEGRRYVSKCPELGVASYGSTPEKSRAALEEALGVFLSNARKLGILPDLEPTLSAPTRYTSSLEVALT